MMSFRTVIIATLTLSGICAIVEFLAKLGFF